MKRLPSDSDQPKRKLSIKIVKQGNQMWFAPLPQDQVQAPPLGGGQNVAPQGQVQNAALQGLPQNIPSQGQVQNVAPPPVLQQTVVSPPPPVQNVPHGGTQAVAPPPQVQNASLVQDRNAQFDFCCFYMGQGDCSLIRCPDGKLVMIDCGSAADFPPENLKILLDLVRHVDWAGPTMRIDALILTHSDRDHYNKVGFVLGEPRINALGYRKLAIDKIYCSDALIVKDTLGDITSISPLGQYTENGLGNVVYDHFFKTSEIQEVTICSENDKDNFYRKWVSTDNFRNWTTTFIANRKYTILQGTIPGTSMAGPKQWSVSLIAGNVPKIPSIADMGDGLHYQDGASADNAKSLITLLEIGTKKLLFSADATFSTERFLLKSHARTPLFSNVEFALVPHHGSEWASCQPFVNTINPRRAVISVGYMQNGFKHPRAIAVNRWLAKVRQDVSRLIDYWEDDADEANSILQEWQTNNESTETKGSLVNLTEVPNVDPDTPVCYAVSGQQWLLYRKETLMNLAETPFGIDEQTPNAPQFLHYSIG